ncbi:MAG TPA: hypothetical protein VNS81_06575 [Nocardioides sp.]|nr:hypothetical protein [Nocardioides sp.]
MGHIGARSLLLAIDGIDYTADVSRAVVRSFPDEAVPLERWSVPGDVDLRPRRNALDLTFAQDAASGALWNLAWDQHGEQVAFHLAPYGNEIATLGEPHFAGTVWVIQPDGDILGGQATPSRNSVLTVQISWPVDGTVERLDSGESYPAALPVGW